MWRAIAQTLLGLVLAATPVTLWIAWSPAMLVGAVALAILCAGLLVLVTEPAARAANDEVSLPEEFLDEVQSLHPMIHHHAGRRPGSRFQGTMRRLSRLVPPARS